MAGLLYGLGAPLIGATAKDFHLRTENAAINRYMSVVATDVITPVSTQQIGTECPQSLGRHYHPQATREPSSGMETTNLQTLA
eukprot:6187451-Amphidinium_carterae.3